MNETKQTNAQKRSFNVEQKRQQIVIFKLVSPLINSSSMEPLGGRGW